MRKYYLYALFDPNLKIPKYIGISNNPERRFKEHLEDVGNTKKTRWIKSLKQGGFLPILKVIKETNDVRQVCKWEIQSIKKLKDKYNLVNTTAGGEYYGIGTPIKEYDINGTYIDTYNSMIEYCEINNLPKNAVAGISSVCLRKRNYTYNKIFRYINDTVTKEDLIRLQKAEHQRDPKSFFVTDIYGNVLYTFTSIQQTKKLGAYSLFSQALNNKASCVYDKYLVMKDLDEYPDKLQRFIEAKSKGTLHAPINKYDLNGIYLQTFYTLKDAAKNIPTREDIIKQCMQGKYQQAGGYIWRNTFSRENIYIKVAPKIHRNTIKIGQFTSDNKLVKVYNTMKEVTSIFSFCHSTLKKHIKNGTILQGYIWKEI